MPFWKEKNLSQMSTQEWESLCDGCAQCCLIRLEDIDTGRQVVTNVACKLLDVEQCRCTDYVNRQKHVPDCIKLTIKNIPEYDWLPETCAYRRVAKGKDLPNWHPLKTGKALDHIKANPLYESLVSEDEIEGDIQDYVVE